MVKIFIMWMYCFLFLEEKNKTTKHEEPVSKVSSHLPSLECTWDVISNPLGSPY